MEQTLESPLPRAFQWADGSAYVNHVSGSLAYIAKLQRISGMILSGRL